MSARFHLVAAKKIWDEEDANEIVQDALLTVSEKYRNADLKSTFTEWAHKVLHNKILDYYRTKSRHGKRFVSTEDTDRYALPSVDNPDLAMRLKECVRKVIKANRKYARVLTYTYQGYSSSDICARLALTKTNFYSLLSRARSMLKHCLSTGEIEH